MDITKAATDWTKAEIFSAQFFIFFGILFLLGSVGFWQWGRTEVAKAYIFPSLIAGALLLAAGCSFYFTNKSKLSTIEADYQDNPAKFVQLELERSQKTIDSYDNVAFKVFPIIVAIAALLIIFFTHPLIRAISITIIAFMVILFLIDSNANARMKIYKEHLLRQERSLK